MTYKIIYDSFLVLNHEFFLNKKKVVSEKDTIYNVNFPLKNRHLYWPVCMVRILEDLNIWFANETNKLFRIFIQQNKKFSEHDETIVWCLKRMFKTTMFRPSDNCENVLKCIKLLRFKLKCSKFFVFSKSSIIRHNDL